MFSLQGHSHGHMGSRNGWPCRSRTGEGVRCTDRTCRGLRLNGLFCLKRRCSSHGKCHNSPPSRESPWHAVHRSWERGGTRTVSTLAGREALLRVRPMWVGKAPNETRRGPFPSQNWRKDSSFLILTQQ